MSDDAMRPAVLTIGHSNRPLDEFVAMLTGHEVQLLADVRKIPRSRANPQFNIDALPTSLAAHGIDYMHLPGLGGLRKPQPNSPNQAWENASFRAFADYMLTPEFEASIDELLHLAENRRVAIMCSEAVPWRCHRSLIADALVVRGRAVKHIMTASQSRPHTLRDFARVEGTQITYPGATLFDK